MAEGEGVVIPIEARDELSSAFQNMTSAAQGMLAALTDLNQKLHDTGDAADVAEEKLGRDGGGFFGSLKDGMDAVNSFKVGDLVNQIQNTSVAGLAVGASMFKGAEAAMSMEEQLTKLSFASKVSRENIDALQSSSYKMSGASKFSAEEFAMVGSRILKMGADIQTTNTVMEASKNLATAWGGDYVGTYMKVEQATKAFGIAAKDMPATMDTIAKVAGETNLSIDELLGPMQRIAPMAKSAGLDFAGISGILAGFNKAGLSGRLAMQGLMMSMQKATKAGVDYQTYMLQTGKAYNLLNTAQERNALLMDRLGPRGAAMSEFFKQTGGDVKKLGEEFGNSAGTAAKQSTMMEGTVGDKLKEIKNHFANASDEISSKWIPGLGLAADAVNALPAPVLAVGTGMAHAAGGTMALVQTVSLFAMAAPKFGAVLSSMGLTLTNFGYSLSTVGLAAVGVTGAFLIWAAAIAAVVAGVVALVYWLYKLHVEKVDAAATKMAGSFGHEVMVTDKATGAARKMNEAVALQGSGAFDKKSAFSALRVENTATPEQRIRMNQEISQLANQGVHVDHVHFEVTKDTTPDQLERMLQGLIRNGKHTQGGGGAPVATR